MKMNNQINLIIILIFIISILAIIFAPLFPPNEPAAPATSGEYEYIDSLVVIREDTSNMLHNCETPLVVFFGGRKGWSVGFHSWTYKTPQWKSGVIGIELNERICTDCLLWQEVKIYHFKRKVPSDYERAMLRKGKKSE